MTERLEIIQFVDGANGKKIPRRVGTAVPKKDGDGFSLYIDAPWGTWNLLMQPPREGGREPQRRSEPREDFKDDIPF